MATLRDALYAAGASETRTRQIVFGVLRRRWREGQTKKRLARIEHGWWKDESRTLGISGSSRWIGDDNILLKELLIDPMEALMGVDPAQAALVDARYSYLPQEARLKLARLQRERLLPGEWTPTGDPEVDAKAELEMARLQTDNGEQIEKLLSSLTPEQRRNTMLAEASEAKNRVERNERQIRDYSERMLAAVAVKFGKNSEEYEMAGRTKKSERKRPTPAVVSPGALPTAK